MAEEDGAVEGGAKHIGGGGKILAGTVAGVPKKYLAIAIMGGLGIGLYLRQKNKAASAAGSSTGGAPSSTTGTTSPNSSITGYDASGNPIYTTGYSGGGTYNGYSQYPYPSGYSPFTGGTISSGSATGSDVAPQPAPSAAVTPVAPVTSFAAPTPTASIPATAPSTPDPNVHYSGPIVSSAAAPNGGRWFLTQDGNVYAEYGAPYYGGAGGDPATNFASGHRIAQSLIPRQNGGYTIVDTAGEQYSYGPDYNKA